MIHLSFMHSVPNYNYNNFFPISPSTDFRATIVQKKDVFFANILAFNADSYYSSS